ncbi:MAG: AbrB/MazE/SpoVT family DNA-binding domain-containing protein [Hyphomonadaceae bacterium]|nr:AbrB/MazE/SpoVT family DNA-binding domain-containing protein [Hyphomonadaceae bacterium]
MVKKLPPGVQDARTEAFVVDPGAPAQKTAAPKGGLKVRRIGNSLGIVLPKDVLAKLRVGEGDMLSVSETPDGVALSAADGETADLMRMAEEIMRKRRKVLKALAQ